MCSFCSEPLSIPTQAGKILPSAHFQRGCTSLVWNQFDLLPREHLSIAVWNTFPRTSIDRSSQLIEIVRQYLVPQSGGGIDTHPKLRLNVSVVSPGKFVCHLAFGFVGVLFFQHRLAAARTGIVDLQPLVDAGLVEGAALAATRAAGNHNVSGPEFLQANGAARTMVFGWHRHKGPLDALLQCLVPTEIVDSRTEIHTEFEQDDPHGALNQNYQR